MYMSQTALFKTLNLFPPERKLVDVERAKGSYTVLPYFLSKILADLPLLAVYPLVFSVVVYPMTGLQPSVRSAVICVLPPQKALRAIYTSGWWWQCAPALGFWQWWKSAGGEGEVCCRSKSLHLSQPAMLWSRHLPQPWAWRWAP